MKKYLSIIFLVFLGLTVSLQSCKDDFLDLNPTEAISEADVFTTTSNAWAALNGVHRFMYATLESGHSSHAGHSGNMIMHDMMGEDLVNHDRGNGWFIGVYNWTSTRNENGAYTSLPYRFFYKLIANTNMIIFYIDGAEGPLAEKEHIKGQALAYRGWAYHQLVQSYAKRYDWNNKPNEQPGVPLVLTPTIAGLPRETVEKVYEQINADLTLAISLLEGKEITWVTQTPKSHLSASVAKGILARVALTQGDWGRAALLAGEARQGKTLMNKAQLMQGLSNSTNPEFLWVSHVQQEHSYAFSSFFSYMTWNRNSTNIKQNPKKICSRLYDSFPESDTRKQWFASSNEEARVRQPNTDYTAVKYMSFKFMAPDEGSGRGDLCYMRTAELYLIEAEALARQGQDGQAQQVLFELVSTRDTNYMVSNNSGIDLIEEIMMNRRLELWGEGFRWLDLKRLNLPLDRSVQSHDPSVATIFEVPVADKRWQYMIPRAELNANPLVNQND